MKIIVIGNGKVGYTLAQKLSAENHDLVIIDENVPALRRADDFLDVMCVRGNGASISVLLEAGVREAGLVIAVTDSDEVNIVCCLLAKKLGAQHTIARMRNPEYSNDSDLYKQEVDLDMIINPELAAAQEISRILRFPFAAQIETFARGRVEMVGFRVFQRDPIIGIPLSSLVKKFSANILFCAVERSGKVTIPDGSSVIQPDDEVYVMGEHQDLSHFFRFLGHASLIVKNILIIGGSRISVYLAWEMHRFGVTVRIIEQDDKKCQHLSELAPHALIIHGDGTDQRLLESENLRSADAFIALTNRDEENLLSALYAQQCGVPKVIAKMTRMNYVQIIRQLGIDSVISPKDITANRILRYVRALINSEGSAVESLYRLLDGSVEVLEFTANATTRFLNTPLRNLMLKKGLLVAAIVRGSKPIIPHGSDMIQQGDRVIIVSRSLFLLDLNDILD